MKKNVGRFGFSFEPIKEYKISEEFGAVVMRDEKVHIGFVIYLYKWVMGFWFRKR